jgi:hypothetical protein
MARGRPAWDGAPYVPTAADLAAQAAADREQEQAERDYRALARVVVAAMRCGCGEPGCLVCRLARWLACGL